MKSKSFYHEIPLERETIQKFSANLLGFRDLIKITFDLAKKDFQRLFIKPTLWKLVFVALPVALIFISFVYVLIQSNFDTQALLDAVRSLFNSNSQDIFTSYVKWFAVKYQSMLSVFIYSILFFTILSSLLNYRNLYLFNNKDIDSIWKTPRSFFKAFLKIFTIGIVYSFISLLIDIVIPDTYTASVIKNILTLVFYGLFGLYEFLILFEESSIIESIKSSYKFSKPYFWKNAIRWLQFTVLEIVTISGIVLVTLVWLIPVSLSNFSPLTVLLFTLMLFAGITCLLIINYVADIYSYLSFLNLKLLGDKENHTTN